MLPPEITAMHLFSTRFQRRTQVTSLLLFVLLIPAAAAVAKKAVPTVDSPHRVGLADSRIGYESAAYRTDSKVVIEVSGIRQALDRLSHETPLGLPAVGEGAQAAEIDLGRQLFFDRRLSANDTLSCAMCHIPEQGFTQNELATPVGHQGKGVRRNVPSLYNVAFVQQLFLDGRESSLVEQIWSPLLAHNEMANQDRQSVIAKIATIETYAQQFERLYSGGLSELSLGLALAAYQRALLSGDSDFDRWYFADGALSIDNYSAEAALGFALFREKGCIGCHQLGDDSSLFSDGGFHNTGIGYLRQQRGVKLDKVQLAPGVYVVPLVSAETETFIDDGRAEVTGQSQNRWQYRTPSLRNVAITFPYMHDGSLPTLESVLAYYGRGGSGDPLQDARISDTTITVSEQQALVAFLRTLTSNQVDALVSDARSVVIGERGAAGL
jgi:cytochrome c peroxidase